MDGCWFGFAVDYFGSRSCTFAYVCVCVSVLDSTTTTTDAMPSQLDSHYFTDFYIQETVYLERRLGY